MAVSRVIEVSFGRSSVALVRIDTAYFYNNGIIFKPTDIDLPASYQVHWADSPQASSTLETIGTAEGAPIPDDLWNRSRVIYGWIYLHPTEDSGITAYEVRIYKNVRAGLPDGTEPTPAEQSTIDQLIGALNSAVEQTGEDVESAEQSAEEAGQSARSASDDADRAEQARTGAETAQGKAEEAQESAERAKDDAETSERNASESERNAKGYSETASEKADSIHSMTASAQTLPAGSSASASYDAQTGVMSFGIPKGKDGTDGDDGYSPTANVSKTGKVATITITDKNGTTSAQVSDGEDGIDGISPSVSVTDITGGHRVVITDKDGTKSFDVEDGATGATPNLTIGTVETLEPTESATATITGTPENPVLNLGIPQGDAGEVTLDEFYKAFPTDTASGSIASFTDGADNLPLKSLIVDINPIQDLSNGDPSPENICPISGWTQVGVEQRGKNLFDKDGTNSVINGYINSSGVFKTSSSGEKCVCVFLPVGMYTVSKITTTRFIVTSFDSLPSNNDTGTVLSTNPNVSKATFTIDKNKWIVCFVYNNTGEANTFQSVLDTVQFELGSTATPYSPYTGRSITIQLGQTVYGGKLDVLSGVLTVDRAMVDLGTLTWNLSQETFQTTSLVGTIKEPTTYKEVPNVICSKYKSASYYDLYAEAEEKTITVIWSSSALHGGIWVRDYSYTSASAFQTAVSGVQLVYPLAEPLTYQLTPTEVKSLLGQNHVWADSGDTEVEYRADTKLYIAKKIAEAISALS